MLRRASLRRWRLLRVAWFSPMRLHEHAVDLLEVDRFGSVADAFDEVLAADLTSYAPTNFSS